MTATPHVRTVVAAAIIVDDQAGAASKLLLAQRRYPTEVAGLWELPGGKVEDGESREAALRREISEELGAEITVGEQIGGPVTLRSDLELVALHATLVAGEPRALDHQALCWVDAVALQRMADAGELVPADTAWLPELVDLLR